MQLCVFGGTGRIGSRVVTEAVARGHVVSMLTRRPPDGGIPGVRVEIGDVLDAAAVARAIGDSEAVIGALGPSGNDAGQVDVLAGGMRNIVAAMGSAGVTRLVTLSGAAIAVPGDHKPAVDRFASRIVRVFARHVVAAKQAEFEVLSASGIRWTALRPPIVTDGDPRGYRLALELRPMARVTRADVARALVDQLDDGSFVGQAPFVLPPG